MCGIFGYVGPEQDVVNLIYSGLKELEYRGYDSWGIAVGRDGETTVVRDVGKLPKKSPAALEGTVGIGHARWATTGAVTVGNAHPHKIESSQIAVVHNGIVENYRRLRQDVLDRGVFLNSQTDTEVAGALVGLRLEVEKCTLEDAVCSVAREVEGHGAFVFADARSEKIVAYKTGSPLYVAKAGESYILASDPSAFPSSTEGIARVCDGDVVAVSKAGAVKRPLNQIAWAPIEFVPVTIERVGTELGEHPHYLIKEIYEQPAVLRAIADRIGDESPVARLCHTSSEIWLTGCGTAFHAGCIGSAMFNASGRKRARAVHAHELSFCAPAIQENDCVVSLTQSGETIDVLDAVRLARKVTNRVAALVNVPGSSITHEVLHHEVLGAGPEKSVLSTKSFTAKLAHLLILVEGEKAKSEVETAANAIERMFSPWMLRSLKDFAEKLSCTDRLFILGSGTHYPLALEGALKIKEVSYLHAEGFPAGELKHGVISLIEPGVPVIAIVPADASRERVLAALEQVKARGAFTVGVAAKPEACFDCHIMCDAGGHAFTLAAGVPFQLLGYYIAVERGLDPDKPRNLAKSVTVR